MQAVSHCTGGSYKRMNLIRIRLEVRVLVNLACPVAAVADDSQAHREDSNV